MTVDAPTPPYYAVVFTSQRTEGDAAAYGATAERMAELARAEPGFLGVESARGADGVGITVSYWRSEDDIRRWHADAEHEEAQRLGYGRWYAWFHRRVCRVERAYGFDRRSERPASAG
jgi:heme-degrading monooxygenase HmoA